MRALLQNISILRVGHETGLFEPMALIMDFVSEFICYGENNIPLLGDSNCILNVGYEDIPVQIDQINVHPNPTSGRFKIDVIEFKKEIESYLITDICGNTILKNNVESFNTNSFDINIENCKPAVYLLIINLKNEKSIYKKIIKI